MGEVVTSYSRTRTASKKKFLVIFCVLFVLLFAIMTVCFVGLFKIKHRQQMIADGKTATAVIYSCTRSGNFSPWSCVYKFVDEDGTKYSGILDEIYKTSKEAEQHIGETLEIYIDGKGECFPVGEVPNIGYSVIWVVISVVLVCADTVGIVITAIKIHKEKQKQV